MRPALSERCLSAERSGGFALLVMLALILSIFTVVAITRLSVNGNELKQKNSTLKSLAQAREAIMGYALTQNSIQRPPGTLPCPDTDNDGLENIVAGVCTSRRGLVPYKTLKIPETFDGTHAPLWYAVATNYAGFASVVPPFRNSSLTSVAGAALLLNAQSVAFIVIAPGGGLDGQQQTTTPLAAITEFLEGDNADGTLNSYTSLQDTTQNDQLLGVTVSEFWQSVERVVLDEASSKIKSYQASCGVYPWASTFTTAGNNSILNNYEGGAPLGTALPSNWGLGCAAAVTLPLWMTYWKDMLYYAICKQAVPVNPPTASCLQLVGATGNSNAKVILLSPSIALAAQNRAVLNIPNFYEGLDNALAPHPSFDKITPTAIDNDLIKIVTP